MKFNQCILGLLSLALVSCMSAPPSASPEKDAEAKKFTTAAGSGNLYVVRKQDGTGSLMAFTVTVDDKALGAVREGQFLYVALEPGQHKLRIGAPSNSPTADVTVVAGKNVFWQVENAGSTTKAGLGLILLEDMGKLMVMQSRLAQGTP